MVVVKMESMKKIAKKICAVNLVPTDVVSINIILKDTPTIPVVILLNGVVVVIQRKKKLINLDPIVDVNILNMVVVETKSPSELMLKEAIVIVPTVCMDVVVMEKLVLLMKK
jgi:hypothetical protein